MPQTQHEVMGVLFGSDIWTGFTPTRAPGEVQGWNGTHPSLSRIPVSGRTIVVDVGVWKGQSTITLARSMKEQGIDGCVIAVDTFLGSPEHWNAGNELFDRKYGQPDLYSIFLSNVYNAGLADYIVPLPQTSITAAAILRRLGIVANIVHIDAAHEYEEVLRDCVEYWPLVAPGGFLIGDDYHVTWPGVVRAAGEFSARHFLPLTIEPPKWIVAKP